MISAWFHLSDAWTETPMKDSMSFIAFYDLDLEDAVLNHSTLSGFCSELMAKKRYQSIMDKES
ncbi:MAG: transposase [Flavobacteriaceae bacterium]|nr:transposase [Flavobacteriaceae bacterium]MCY4267872.1 transposase [Flavobacteriaceae bacterium]